MSQSQRQLNLKERFFKFIFRAGDHYRIFLKWFAGLCSFTILISLLIFLIGLIFYLGFGNTETENASLKYGFRLIFIVIFFAKILPEILQFRWEGKKFQIVRIIINLFLTLLFLVNFNLIGTQETLVKHLLGNSWIIVGILIIAISELSVLQRIITAVKIPPAAIFSASFMTIIFIGSGLLMLPEAHVGKLSYIDSLFTSVSAVCVTGLVVVDTATTFTILGKLIIMCLIQIGGLGIMTFTGFFAFIFVSGSSFRDKLLLKELFSSESMNNLFSLLAKIITFTFIIETAGAIMIFSSLGQNIQDKIFFSAFHSISAFCNAGFSTLPYNLNANEVMDNYTLQIAVMMLIVLGGIGFPVLIGLYSDSKYYLRILYRKLRGRLMPIRPGKRNVARKIVIVTTLFLIFTGAGLYYIFEDKTSLSGMTFFRKIMISFFGSISARTAGFNVTDITLWSYPTIFLIIILMYIGASPGSTGGGIKTTTFAIALRSTWNNIRGKNHFMIGNREIGNFTITRVLSIIILSIVVVFSGFMIMMTTENGKEPVSLLFECFSAYGTVGLSITDSSTLTSPGKIIDMLLMFIGRVGPLTLLSGFLISYRKKYSRYPEVEIIIN